MNPIKPTLLLAILLAATAQAQQVFTQDVQISSQNAATPNLKTTGPGGVVFGGTLGTGAIPTTGDGVRMMWYPKKGAFRAGYTSAGLWNDANIGDYSIAMGGNSSAPGFAAVALGPSAAGGHQAFSAGWGSTASGQFAVAMGIGTATGDFTFAAAQGTASGYGSVALGGGLAIGNYSFAFGPHATSVAVESTVVGLYNKLTGDPSLPASSDPVFIVGTGTSDTNRKNGFEVRRDGTILMAKPQGDISMGQFSN